MVWLSIYLCCVIIDILFMSWMSLFILLLDLVLIGYFIWFILLDVIRDLVIGICWLFIKYFFTLHWSLILKCFHVFTLWIYFWGTNYDIWRCIAYWHLFCVSKAIIHCTLSANLLFEVVIFIAYFSELVLELLIFFCNDIILFLISNTL
jgi:hypothetical protein